MTTIAHLAEMPDMLQKHTMEMDIDKADMKQSLQVSSTMAKDARFWWNALGPFLRKLLNPTHYDDASRQQVLLFTREMIVPYLGPAPTQSGQPSQWRSFMTDDFTPIEFSWTWSNNSRAADHKVRFSIEPIGYEAGSANDPWNQAASLSLLGRLSQSLTKLDLGWFYSLLELSTPNRSATATTNGTKDLASTSSVFLAFEFGNSEPMVKAYLMPGAMALATGQTEEVVMRSMVRGFATKHNWQHLLELQDILDTSAQSLSLKPLMVAIDCVVPRDSRFKIYLRSPNTSFATIRQVMGLFDKSINGAKGIEKLRQLYALVFGLEDSFDESSQLSSRQHQTAGMLFYVEVRPNSNKKTVKVYLPVKHYAKNDRQAAKALTTFFRKTGEEQDDVCNNFLNTLQSLCDHRPLSSSRGVQTYLSCAIRGDVLDLTSYMNPELYHPQRYV